MFLLANDAYHLFCQKFQCSVATDHSKQISDTHHLDKQGRTETTEDFFCIKSVNNTKDHRKCHADDTNITVSCKSDHDGSKKKDQ